MYIKEKADRLKYKLITHAVIFTLCLWVLIARGSESDDSRQALERSLQEFDDKILRELEETQQARQENARQKAALRGDAELEAEGEAEGDSQGQNEGEEQDAGGQYSESGQDGNETASNSSQEDTDQKSDATTEDTETMQTQQTSAESQQQEASSNTQVSEIPSGDDDDVIARQLREAAEAETDPELKEKLWEEYRKYKNQQNPGP
jgi:hypothetical protein